jgi:hypothetical protein
LIELHSVPPSTRAVAGYRIGVSQSGRLAVCAASMSAVEVKRAFIGLELGLAGAEIATSRGRRGD